MIALNPQDFYLEGFREARKRVNWLLTHDAILSNEAKQHFRGSLIAELARTGKGASCITKNREMLCNQQQAVYFLRGKADAFHIALAEYFGETP